MPFEKGLKTKRVQPALKVSSICWGASSQSERGSQTNPDPMTYRDEPTRLSARLGRTLLETGHGQGNILSALLK